MIVCNIGANVKAKLEEGFQGKIGTLGDWESKITFYVGRFLKTKQITIKQSNGRHELSSNCPAQTQPDSHSAF